jgi:acyl carrier protein
MTTSVGLPSITQWILDKHPERTSIDPEEDLIVNRLIDSLSFVEFVFLIEQESGASIDIENIDLEQFRTLGAIEKAYFA